MAIRVDSKSASESLQSLILAVSGLIGFFAVKYFIGGFWWPLFWGIVIALFTDFIFWHLIKVIYYFRQEKREK